MPLDLPKYCDWVFRGLLLSEDVPTSSCRSLTDRSGVGFLWLLPIAAWAKGLYRPGGRPEVDCPQLWFIAIQAKNCLRQSCMQIRVNPREQEGWVMSMHTFELLSPFWCRQHRGVVLR